MECQGKFTSPSWETSMLIDLMYPIGSIYMTVADTNPFETLGIGTWEKIENRFLLAASDTHANGETGGEESHVLTIDEMPTHKHLIRSGSTPTTDTSVTTWGFSDQRLYTEQESKLRDLDSIGYTGNDQAHNNMPPYLAVNIWKRIA